jgi:[pyruvate, water dikinase]-phosphate phosphotransferase / [pyruvate, water dikinase] kinase
MSLTNSTPAILIISGGIGASAAGLVNTALAQFPGDAVQLITVGNVRQPEQITAALLQAQILDALVIYTLVDPQMRDFLLQEVRRLNLQALDMMTPLLEWVAAKTGIPPRGEPGLYRQIHREYFERVSAIDFTMAHDDGQRPDGWLQAEIMLVGVSRVGKTPLSLYLAVLGWKVANYPLVPGVPPPDELFSLDAHRVFGLTVEPGQLLQYRMHRQRRLGAPGASTYVDPQSVYDEVEEALKLFRRGRFTIIDMTDKTIELGADEIIRYLS